MKKLFRKIRLSTVACAAAAATACGSDWLELSDPNSLSPSNFPTKIEHVDLLVNSVYGVQHHWCFLGNYWAGYVMYCLDHTIDSCCFRNAGKHDLSHKFPREPHSIVNHGKAAFQLPADESDVNAIRNIEDLDDLSIRRQCL